MHEKPIAVSRDKDMITWKTKIKITKTVVREWCASLSPVFPQDIILGCLLSER